MNEIPTANFLIDGTVDELIDQLKSFEDEFLPKTDKGRSLGFVAPILAGNIIYRLFNMEDGKGINRGFLVLKDTRDILVYNGIYYENVGDIMVRNITQRVLGDECKKGRKDEVIDWVKDCADIIIEREMLDHNPTRIRLHNGIYDIDKDKIDDHVLDGYPSTCFPIEYDPKATCPRWIQFLDEVLYTEDIPCIQEMMGYCFYKPYIFQKAFMLVGSGANGKSVLLHVLCRLLGEWNFSTIPLQRIGRDRFTDLDLVNKFANICADLSEKAVEHTGNFKQITGGDWIRAEKKYAPNGILFRNTAKLIFSANLIPKCNDETYAYSRRWIVIEFPNVFRDDDPKTDHHLEEKLFQEIPGIFNWCMEGLKRLLKQQMFSPHKTLDEVQQYMAEHKDGVRDYIDTYVSSGSGKYAKSWVYKQYLAFCERHEYRAIGRKPFSTRFTDLAPMGVQEYHGKNRGWSGILIQDIDEIPRQNEEEIVAQNEQLTGGLYINGKLVEKDEGED